jgi:hypothetical protein
LVSVLAIRIVLMTNKNCLELHGNLKLSTWLSNLLIAQLRIVPLGDSYYPSFHAGLYQQTRIIFQFTLAYTNRLVLSFSSRWLIPRDSYYPSVHSGLYRKTRIILQFTLAYTKRLVLSFSSHWFISRASYYPSVHVGLYQETRIILQFMLAYTKRLVLYFCPRWICKGTRIILLSTLDMQRDSYYTSAHASLCKEKKLSYGRWESARILSPLLDSTHSYCDWIFSCLPSAMVNFTGLCYAQNRHFLICH